MQLPFNNFAESLFSNSVDGIFILDPELRIRAWNNAMEEISGYRAAEVTGKKVLDLFVFFNSGQWKGFFQAVLKGKRIKQTDLPYQIPERGKQGWADMAFFPYRNPAGEVEGIIGLIHNTTKRKAAEIALQRNEELYRLVAKNSTDFISRHDLAGCFTFASGAAERLTGYKPEELLKKCAYDFISPEDMEAVRQSHLELFRSGQLQEFTYRFKHKNGEFRWLESSSTAIKDPETGQLLEIQVASRDITARRQTEESLRTKSKLLNGLLSNLPVLVKRISEDGEPLFMQGKALRKLGLDQEKWKETHLSQEEPEVQEGVRKAMRGESVSLIERHLHQGKPVYFQSYFFPDLEYPGGAIGFSIDITEQQLAEEKLRRNQNFIQRITDSAPFVITIFDFSKGYFIYTNKQIPEVLGYSLDEIQQMGPAVFMKLVHPDDLLEMASYIHRVASAKDGEILTIEVRVRDKKGHWRWFMSRSSVFARDANGLAIKGLSVTQDIDQSRRDKDLLSGVLDNSPNGIMALNAIRDEDEKIIDFEWTLVNATSGRLTSLNPASLLGKRLLAKMPHVEELGLFKRYLQVMETGQPMAIEIYQEKKGKPQWQAISAVRMATDGLMLTLTDITEAKLAREKIRKSEALLSEARKIANLGIWDWDIVADKLTWSEEMYQIAGLDLENEGITFQKFVTLVHADDLESFHKTVSQSVEQIKPYELQLRIKTPAGDERIISNRGEVQTDENRKPVRMVGTTIDVTELVHMRQELESTAQLRQIGEAIPQFVWTTLPNGKNEYLNRRWYEYTGLPENEPGMLEWETVVHEEDLPLLKEKWEKCLKTGNVLEMEFRVRRHDGAYRWHLVRTVPMHDEQGNLFKWFGSATDIQEQKQIEQQLRQTQLILSDYNEVLNLKNAQLEKINADLDNFIYTASHDLKAPIHNIEGLIEVLSTEIEEPGPVIQSVLDMILKSINRFKSTVLDLTEITKVERSLQEEVSEVNLPGLLSEIVSDIAPMMLESEAQLDTDFQVASLLFSRKNMRSILYNLVSNAIKYRAPERALLIRIGTKAAGQNQLELTITDNGLGIDERSQTRVFEMFRRVHTHVEGTGVGLYIVKRIIENAGGDISLQSTPGHGSVFRILLPFQGSDTE